MVCGNRLDDSRGLPEPFGIIGADAGMGSLHLVIDRLPDIVKESGPLCLLDVHLQFGRHHSREMGHINGMLKDILGIARPKLQAAQQHDQLGMQIVDSDIEGDPLSGFLDDRIHLRPHLLDDLFDPTRMDAAVGDQSLQGKARHFPAHRIEAGKHDRLRRVIDNQVYSCRRLDRPNVSSLPADDSSLHLIIRKVDHRDRVFGHIITCVALDRIRDDLTRLIVGRPPGILLDFSDGQGGILLRSGFHFADQQFFCFL